MVPMPVVMAKVMSKSTVLPPRRVTAREVADVVAVAVATAATVTSAATVATAITVATAVAAEAATTTVARAKTRTAS